MSIQSDFNFKITHVCGTVLDEQNAAKQSCWALHYCFDAEQLLFSTLINCSRLEARDRNAINANEKIIVVIGPLANVWSSIKFSPHRPVHHSCRSACDYYISFIFTSCCRKNKQRNELFTPKEFYIHTLCTAHHRLRRRATFCPSLNVYYSYT